MTTCRPPIAHPSRPAAKLPDGAWDCHCHVFGPEPRFPYASQRSYTPPDAPFEAMRSLHAHLGIDHAVIVQANCHGFDHSALIDALDRSGGRYRGVALLPDGVTRGQVEQLHAAGVRGARFNFVRHLGGPPDMDAFHETARLIADFGWHVALHIDGSDLTALMPDLASLPVPFIVDHMGRIEAGQGFDAPGFQALLQLSGVRGAWVKVSGVDRISAGRRPYPDGLAFVRRLAETMPEQLLWGTDWPHPNVSGDMPDDGELVDLFFEACADSHTRRQILVDNPTRLYDLP